MESFMTTLDLSQTSMMQLALMAGLVSLVSTSIGSFLNFLTAQKQFFKKTNLSLDFALGLMLSTTAFSLVGPEVIASIQQKNNQLLSMCIAGIGSGMIFVGILHKMTHQFQMNHFRFKSMSKIILVVVLFAHNFPEGMGSAATLIGMNRHEGLMLQIIFSLQNMAEGFLITMALMGLGLNLTQAVIGGIISGAVESLGAILSGYALEHSLTLLPFLLTLAGGAMLMSVLIELYEAHLENRQLQIPSFTMGLLSIPLINLLL